jgi:3-oxoacyl-[acyl-carrier protein] reductase
MTGFADQVVLVTGASRGIGRAVALRFAGAGAHVVVNYRSDEAGAQETVAQIVALSGKATPVQADIARPAELERMVAGVEDRCGPIEVLVNNAAAFDRTHFLDLSLDEFDAVWATNGRGLFYLSQLVARRMAPRGHGAIVHISSLLAQQTIPGAPPTRPARARWRASHAQWRWILHRTASGLTPSRRA